MIDGMTKIRSYNNEFDAEADRNRLEALGVTAVLRKDNCGGMRPHLDVLFGVQVLVAEADLDRAREILDDVPDAAPAPDWKCAGCEETIEGRFDTCWNCGFERN